MKMCEEKELEGKEKEWKLELSKNKENLNEVISDVSIFGELRQVNIEDLIKVPEIINTDAILKVKEMGNLIYDDRALKMLNVFVYYCIKVSNNINLDGI